MTVEHIVFAVYITVLLGVGFYFSRQDKSLEDYLLGGRRLGGAVTALTMQATSMSGYMFMGGPAFTYQTGWFGLWYAVGDAGGAIINLSVLGRRMRRLSQILGALSPIEYLEKRYESPAIRVIGSLIAVVFLSAYVIAQFIASGKALMTLTGLSYEVSLIVGVGVILTYTVAGGYLAVAWSDFIQGIIMVVGLAGVLIVGLVRVGGLTGLNNALAKLDPTYLSLWGKGLEYNGQWGVALGALLIYAIGYMGLPHVVVRHMSMQSPKTTKTAILWATFWNQLFVYSPYVLGLIGIVMLPNLTDPELVVPELAYEFFPGFFAAIMLSAIMAAIMSTSDSLLMQSGSILARDVYQRFINPSASQGQMVLVSRLLILFVGIFGVILAIIQPPTVFGLVVFAFGVLGNSFMVPYVAAVYWEEANKVGAMAAMVGGALGNVLWTSLNLQDVTALHPFLAGLLISIGCMLVFNRFGSSPSREVIEAVRRAKGSAHLVEPKGAAAHLAPEARAIAEHLASREAVTVVQAGD